MPLTVHGKQAIARAMYHRGKSFLAASILLRQKDGYQYVVLHLMCQGIEIILKSLLLFADYDKYRPQLAKKFGHNLLRLSIKVLSVHGLGKMRLPVKRELEALNAHYMQHGLRYADIRDILIDGNSIEYRLVLARIVATVKLCERELHRQTGA